MELRKRKKPDVVQEHNNNCPSFIRVLWMKGYCIKAYGHDDDCEYRITAKETKFVQSVVMQKISKKKEIKIKGNKEVK